MIDINKIQEILPHRYPFLLIDRVIELQTGKRIVAVKNVSYNEEFFSGHFPGRPVMPGVLIIEAMAQASILLFYSEKEGASNSNMKYYLGSVKVRFLHPVSAGDQLKVTVEPIKIISGIGICSAVASVDGKEVARGEISFSAKKD
jgi:3-hydroxyacyl-[acyl-carrier-protein] dehydratase